MHVFYQLEPLIDFNNRWARELRMALELNWPKENVLNENLVNVILLWPMETKLAKL